MFRWINEIIMKNKIKNEYIRGSVEVTIILEKI